MDLGKDYYSLKDIVHLYKIALKINNKEKIKKSLSKI